MGTVRLMGPAAVVIGAMLLTGCVGGNDVIPEGAAPSASPRTDDMTCVAFGDVLTIVINADAGLRDGRMAAQEQQGWYRLATRVLDRLPARGEGAVDAALVDLKAAAPVIALSANGASGIGSPGWENGYRAMSEACADAGAELGVESFTGG